MRLTCDKCGSRVYHGYGPFDEGVLCEKCYTKSEYFIREPQSLLEAVKTFLFGTPKEV